MYHNMYVCVQFVHLKNFIQNLILNCEIIFRYYNVLYNYGMCERELSRYIMYGRYEVGIVYAHVNRRAGSSITGFYNITRCIILKLPNLHEVAILTRYDLMERQRKFFPFKINFVCCSKL